MNPLTKLDWKHAAGITAVVAGAFVGGLVTLTQVMPPQQPQARRTTFAFDPSTDPIVVGYCIYWGGHPSTRTNHLNIGTNLIVTIEHYESKIDAVVCSYDQFHVESLSSNPAGKYYNGIKDEVIAQTSSNMTDWQDAFTVLTITNVADMQFYRLRIHRKDDTFIYP